MILARGGGSAVRLPDDTEVVARAVATCTVPVIAAIGHAGQAEALVRTARATLRRGEAAVGHLGGTLTPPPSPDGGQEGGSTTGPGRSY